MTTARYFFDDGKSRKFWSYTQTGKTLTIRHGKLGSKGRETIKTFGSPAAAKREAQKLGEQKTSKGYIHVDPTPLKLKRPKGRRKATEGQIAAPEKQLGKRLPAEYRSFLLTHNGGRLELADGSFELFGHPSPYGHIGCVEVLYTLQKNAPAYESLQYAIEKTMPLMPSGHLPISESGGNTITIDLENKPGCIYLFDHELPEYDDYEDIEALEEKYGSAPFLMKHATLLAGSFDEFLTRIASYRDVEERPEAEPQSGTKKNKRKPKPTIRRLLRLMKRDCISEEFEGIKEIEELIAQLADLSEIKDGEWPKIHRFDNPRLLSRLLDAGLNPEIADKDGSSLLCQCVMNPECIDLMLDQGVAVDRRSGRDDETALMRAAAFGSEACVKRLLDGGANPTLEFTGFAETILKMNEKKRNLIETARAEWSRKQGKKKAQGGKRHRKRSRKHLSTNVPTRCHHTAPHQCPLDKNSNSERPIADLLGPRGLA